MSANTKTANKVAAASRRSSEKKQSWDDSATFGHASQNTPIPEGAKQGGELPRGWSEQRIEQLFAPLEDGRTLHQGWSPQCDKIPSPSEEVWGVLKTTSIQAGEFQPEHNKLLPPGLEPRPMIEVKEGDILLTCAGPRVRCGVSCLVRQTRKRLMMSGKMYRFRVNPEEHDARYIEAFLQTERARQAIDKMKTGSSDSGLNLTHERFRQLPVPVAPLPEQRRIVAEIEKQFTRLESGVAALRRVQANLKRYRAAVLKAACEGKLVPTEHELSKAKGRSKKDETTSSFLTHTSSLYESGEALLRRILTERRQNWQGRGKYKEPVPPDTANLSQLPEGWIWCISDAIFSFITSGSRGWAEFYSDSGPLFLRIGNLEHEDIRLDLSELQHVTPPKGAEGTRTVVQPNDILISITADVGMVGLVPDGLGEAYINQHVALARPLPGVNPAYIAFYLCASEGGWGHLKKLQRGATKVGLGLDDIRSVPIPLPPLAEQTRIVAEVERRLSVVEELESVVTANLQRAVRLRQSILQKAFTGELA